MTAMLATVLAFAIINYGLKAVGPVVVGDREFPDRLERVVEALPAALLAGMLVTSMVGARGSDLDATTPVGLTATVVAWRLGAGPLLCVVTCLAVTICLRAAF